MPWTKEQTIKNANKSKKVKFDDYTSEKEQTLSKLTGNLKTYIKFISADVYLNKNSIVLDLGANIGKFTSIFARFGSTIYAFEPTKCTFDVLNNRFINNNKVHCINKACYTEDKIMKFYHHELSDYNKIYWSVGNTLLNNKTNINKNDFEEVEAIDLSKFIFSLNKQIDLVKMDIEGSEFQIINHLIDTKAIDKINILICETHEKKNNFLKNDLIKLKERINMLNLNSKIYLDWK